MRVYSSAERSFTEIRHIAVAVATVQSDQQHIGILHKRESADEVKLAHLAWHNELKESAPRDSYLWIDPPISARRARQVAARCRQILRTNGKRGIPYAFSPPNDCFDVESGTFLLGPSRVGLTCASFVLAVFDVSGLPLADYTTWPTRRSGDTEWQRFVIEQLRDHGASDEHLQLVLQEVGNVRFRPEDVAGCAASDRVPCRFDIAESLSRTVLDKLHSHAKPLNA